MKVRFVLAAVAAILCTGCAGEPYWHEETDAKMSDGTPWKPNGVVKVYTIDTEMYTRGSHEGYHVKNGDGSCDIFVMRKATSPECTEAHERIHCEGFAHKAYGVTFNTCAISQPPRR